MKKHMTGRPGKHLRRPTLSRPCRAFALAALVLTAACEPAGQAPEVPAGQAPEVIVAEPKPAPAPGLIPADAPDLDPARAAIGAYAHQLKGELMEAMGWSAVNAVQICDQRAGQIAEETGRQHGVTVGRTALRVRNPANTPDEWQRTMLQSFSQALATGSDAGSLGAYTHENGRHRYMQPIVTQPLCLGCHGKNIAPDLQSEIARLYPQDQAIGFRAGDLRGAFVVEWDDNS